MCDHLSEPLLSSVFVAFRVDWWIVLFIVWLIFVLVDLVPVSSDQLVGVDQGQLFEEEEQFLGKEGKWSCPPAWFYLSYAIA
jgi:hypothetical protein